MFWDHYGSDGYPIMPNANPGCPDCKGFGVMEDGEFHYASVLIICPSCIDVEEVPYEELGTGD